MNKSNWTIRSRAPLRVSFAGGGTDIKEYYEKYGGVVISSSISKYAYATLRPLKDGKFRIRQENLGIDYSGKINEKLTDTQELGFLNAIVRHFSPKDGFDLITHSDVNYGSGLGASSTMIVAIVGAFNKWLNLDLDHYEIAETAYKIEREDLGIKGGAQDQYAASFGGFNFIEFMRDAIIVNQMRLKPSTIYDLQFRLLMVHTGSSHSSSRILSTQINKLSDSQLLEHYDRLKRLAVDVKGALYKDDLDTIGPLLKQEWEEKKLLSPGISTKEIEKIINVAYENGASGAKVLGAGGGGYALLFTDEDNRFRLANAMQKLGVEANYPEFDYGGLETWSLYKKGR
jgi:D-glycero-alpha-D-manno-heptose-7-phosphate kinase